MTASPWTPRRVALLRRYWKNGKTAAEIAEDVGLSRSAVCGKAQRLGMAHAADSPIRRKTRAANANRRPRPTKTAPPPKQVRLADLTEQQCRYPYGDRPADMRFCGHPVMERGDWRAPYCEFHQGRCYRAPEMRAKAKQSTSQTRGRLSLAIPT